MSKYSEQVRQDAAKAAAYIREHGWIQGDYFVSKTDQTGACCALGAIRTTLEEANDECLLAQAFAQEVGLPQTYGIHRWNDAPGRTKEEVLAVFDRIANS